jgi:hypothetical protein
MFFLQTMNRRRTVFIIGVLILSNTLFLPLAFSKVETAKAISSKLNLYDKILYKKVALRGCDRSALLVNRLTGEVKYIFQNNEWILLVGMWKKQYQLKYDAQRAAAKRHSEIK